MVNNYLMGNNNQLLYLSFYNFFLIKNKFLKKSDKNYFFFFDYFLKKYFSIKIKKNIFLSFDDSNIFFFENNKFYNWFVNLLKKNNITSLISTHSIRNLMEIFLIFFYKKDTNFLTSWLKSILESLYYKNHKKFLNTFKLILIFIFKYFNIYFKLKGLFFKLKGKIGLSGNSKKKTMNVFLGSYSFSRKINKIDYNKEFIKTVSGTLGFCLFIFF